MSHPFWRSTRHLLLLTVAPVAVHLATLALLSTHPTRGLLADAFAWWSALFVTAKFPLSLRNAALPMLPVSACVVAWGPNEALVLLAEGSDVSGNAAHLAISWLVVWLACLSPFAANGLVDVLVRRVADRRP